MVTVIKDQWRSTLLGLVRGTRKDLVVVTPYFQNKVIEDILGNCSENMKIRFLLGSTTKHTMVDRSTDHFAIMRISQFHRAACKFSKNLHAKVLVSDGADNTRKAIVTSANLTEPGLESNAEIGVMLDGEPAKEIAEHMNK